MELKNLLLCLTFRYQLWFHLVLKNVIFVNTMYWKLLTNITYLANAKHLRDTNLFSVAKDWVNV